MSEYVLVRALQLADEVAEARGLDQASRSTLRDLAALDVSDARLPVQCPTLRGHFDAWRRSFDEWRSTH